MPRKDLKYVLRSNDLVRKKIKLFRGQFDTSLRAQRYLEIVMDSFSQLSSADDMNDVYEDILDVIEELWISSSKDPSIFQNAKEFEQILLKSTQSYRDHFIHSYNVFLLGYYIVNRLFGLPSFNAQTYFGNSSRANLTWMLTSTFHDVAYTIQETESWMNKLFEEFFGVDPNFSFGISEVLPFIYVDFMRVLSNYHKRGVSSSEPFSADLENADLTFYSKMCSKLVMKDHGVLSGLMLAHLLATRTFPRREDMWEFFYNHMPACHAIVSHTMESVRIQFRKHPFAFLLILLDEIQDYGRPSNRDSTRLIRLVNIRIEHSKVPEIKFILRVNQKGRNHLEILNERLVTNGKIKVSLLKSGESLPFLAI